MRNRKRSLRGFSIIEVVSVVAILAILTALVIPSLYKIRANTNEAVAQSTLRTIGSAMSAYKLEKSGYPSDLSELAPSNDVPVNVGEEMATRAIMGYRFQIVSANQTAYRVTATPEDPPVTGNHIFILTETGLIQNGGVVTSITGSPNAVQPSSGNL